MSILCFFLVGMFEINHMTYLLIHQSIQEISLSKFNLKVIINSYKILTFCLFSRLIKIAISDLEDKHRKYKSDPESHPLYSTEWKIFWEKRANELRRGN